MDANTFFINQQAQQVASRALGAIQQVRRASTLRQVRDAGHVTLPGYLHCMRSTIPELSRLNQACEERAQELVNQHLEKLAEIAAASESLADRIARLKDAYGTLRQHEWVFLRGDYATLYGSATRRAEQLISQLQSKLVPDT